MKRPSYLRQTVPLAQARERDGVALLLPPRIIFRPLQAPDLHETTIDPAPRVQRAVDKRFPTSRAGTETMGVPAIDVTKAAPPRASRPPGVSHIAPAASAGRPEIAPRKAETVPSSKPFAAPEILDVAPAPVAPLALRRVRGPAPESRVGAGGSESDEIAPKKAEVARSIRPASSSVPNTGPPQVPTTGLPQGAEAARPIRLEPSHGPNPPLVVPPAPAEEPRVQVPVVTRFGEEAGAAKFREAKPEIEGRTVSGETVLQVRKERTEVIVRAPVITPPPIQAPPRPERTRSAGLHIGVIEVRIVDTTPKHVPEAVGAPARAQPRAHPAAVSTSGRIARGFGVYGLGQS